MKLINTLFLATTILIIACSNSVSGEKGGTTIKGKLNNSSQETIYLERLTSKGVTPVDTTTINEKGEFEIAAKIPDIGFYRIKITDKNFATLIIDPKDKITIEGDAKDLGNTYKIKGSAESLLFNEINQASMKNYQLRDSIQKVFQKFTAQPNMTQARADSMSSVLQKPFNEITASHNKFLNDFVLKHPSSFASLAAIQQLNMEEFFPTYLKLDEELYKKYPNSEYLQQIHQNVQANKNTAIGAVAPEINMNTPEDKALPLSSLKGKVVLVDFWASWCGPCRKENPNVVAAYNKYKDKGFDIYSVSLDQDKEKWKQAIIKDNLTWTNHVCDYKGWQTSVVKQYNFSGIPYSVLIDKDGKIIAKNLRGEALEKKLAEVLK